MAGNLFLVSFDAFIVKVVNQVLVAPPGTSPRKSTRRVFELQKAFARDKYRVHEGHMPATYLGQISARYVLATPLSRSRLAIAFCVYGEELLRIQQDVNGDVWARPSVTEGLKNKRKGRGRTHERGVFICVRLDRKLGKGPKSSRCSISQLRSRHHARSLWYPLLQRNGSPKIQQIIRILISLWRKWSMC
jgi:hypothetical protein